MPTVHPFLMNHNYPDIWSDMIWRDMIWDKAFWFFHMLAPASCHLQSSSHSYHSVVKWLRYKVLSPMLHQTRADGCTKFPYVHSGAWSKQLCTQSCMRLSWSCGKAMPKCLRLVSIPIPGLNIKSMKLLVRYSSLSHAFPLFSLYWSPVIAWNLSFLTVITCYYPCGRPTFRNQAISWWKHETWSNTGGHKKVTTAVSSNLMILPSCMMCGGLRLDYLLDPYRMVFWEGLS